MPSPFPGMDPFIEAKNFWTDFHARINIAMSDAIQPLVRPRFYATVEHRLIIETPDLRLADRIPDVTILSDPAAPGGGAAVLDRPAAATQPLTVVLPTRTDFREHFIEIHDADGGEVVTVIETLSPRNKCKGEAGRGEYEAKRDSVLVSDASLVEIDLLRCGRPFEVGAAADQLGDYRVLVSCPWQRPRAELYAVPLLSRLPTIAVPLREEDEAVPLDLQEAVDAVYERAGYDRFDYATDITPPLPEAAKDLLASRGQG